MKTILSIILCLLFVSRLTGFEWPGGTMTVSVTFRGDEVFAGWVPSSPWGSTPFLSDPAVELRDTGNNIIADQIITGNIMNWYEDGIRSGTAVFTAPAGSYFLTTRAGVRLIRISGEGWSGFRLTEESLTPPVPPNSAPTVSWSSAQSAAASGEIYMVSAHGHDDDGNLTQVSVWKDGQPFAFAGGGNGTDGDSGNSTSDAGPQSITYTAQATDATGAVSAMITLTVTVAAPSPAFYTLTTFATTGGSVSAGGVFGAGSAVTIVATPDAQYDFAGWSGDAGGADNPLSVTVARDLGIVANFSPKAYALTTSALSGGAVTPGGSYPFGATVSISANPDAVHYFTGWSGDAGGSAPSIGVLIDRPKFVQAQFAPKAAQTIFFAAPGNQQIGAIVPLTATSSSGLPVTFEVVSGPAALNQGQLTVTGPGAIAVRALQNGDAFTLPAAPVTASFNATAPAVLRYQPVARTLLHDGRTATAANYVVSTP